MITALHESNVILLRTMRPKRYTDTGQSEGTKVCPIWIDIRIIEHYSDLVLDIIEQ